MSDIAVNTREPKQKIPTTPSPSISSDAPETGNSVPQFPILLQGLSQEQTERAKEHWQTMKTASEKLATAVREGYSTAATESMDYSIKLMANASANAQAALQLATSLAKAKTPSEIIEISTAHARRQMEVMQEQNRQLWTAAQKIATSMFAGNNKKSPDE